MAKFVMECPHCGNNVAFDQSKGDQAKCPVCGEPINDSHAAEGYARDFREPGSDKDSEEKDACFEEIVGQIRAKKRRNKIIAIFACAVILALILLVTHEVLPAMRYSYAEELLAAGQREEAKAAFEALEDYKDASERAKEISYQDAEKLLEAGDACGAAIAFGKVGSYGNAREQALALWGDIAVRDTIGAGTLHTVGLNVDGTMVAVGDNDCGQCDVSDWRDIVAISAGNIHTVGLKADGTLVAVGSNDYGQCDVSDWRDIVAISAGEKHTVGLKADGTVIAVGENDFAQCDVSDWTDIVAISAGRYHTVGLKTDGTVVANEFTDTAVYLTGIGYFSRQCGQSDVSDWTDIVAISAGAYHTVGLKANGTVVAVGRNDYGQCDVSDWRDIVAISAGAHHTVGLKSDGTVVAVGDNGCGQCDVSDWRDIVAISAGAYHTVGLQSNGTVVAVGDNLSGQCEVSDWTDIKLPN